jgi:hypothetical protein
MSDMALTAVVGGRRSGKTARLMEWVAEGEPIDQYPHWSRVVLTTTHEQSMILRDALKDRYLGRDIYCWVYSVDEWRRAYRTSPDVEVAIDNADALLQGMVGRHRLARVSMTCKVDDPVSRAEGAPQDG